jgi:hypothetical protein
MSETAKYLADASATDELNTSQEESFEELLNNSVKSGMQVGYLSCGLELQIDAANRLADLLQQLNMQLAEAICSENGGKANELCVSQMFLYGCYQFLCVWIYAKRDEMRKSWEALVDSQAAIERGLKHRNLTGYRHFLWHLEQVELVLFPAQTFTSPSIQFRKAICSICGEEYGECTHISGRLYMGRECEMLIQDIDQINHQAVVAIPKDKGCRFVSFQSGEEIIDCLTRRVISRNDVAEGGKINAKVILFRERHEMQVFRFEQLNKDDPR